MLTDLEVAPCSSKNLVSQLSNIEWIGTPLGTRADFSARQSICLKIKVSIVARIKTKFLEMEGSERGRKRERNREREKEKEREYLHIDCFSILISFYACFSHLSFIKVDNALKY